MDGSWMKMVFGSVVMVVFQSVVYSKILQNKIQKHKKKKFNKKNSNFIQSLFEMQYQTGAKSDTMISYLYITLIFMKV
jgi:hypothetical protein